MGSGTGADAEDPVPRSGPIDRLAFDRAATSRRRSGSQRCRAHRPHVRRRAQAEHPISRVGKSAGSEPSRRQRPLTRLRSASELFVESSHVAVGSQLRVGVARLHRSGPTPSPATCSRGPTRVPRRRTAVPWRGRLTEGFPPVIRPLGHRDVSRISWLSGVETFFSRPHCDG